MPDPHMAPTAPMKADEIYVGYLPVPAGIRRFLRWSVPTILWISCIACVVWSRSQPDPGAGVWEDSTPVTVEGTLIATPYPLLMLDDAPAGSPSFALLVEPGKHGASARAGVHHATHVRLRGYPIHRDGRQIFELLPDADAIAPTGQAPAPVPESRPMGRVTLRGEIVDSKCFLGAMKPGEGKTHKACATLCITGGIPPMLVTRDAAGTPEFTLLSSGTDGPLDPEAYTWIGEPVNVTGDLFVRGGLRVLRVQPSDITPR